MHEELTYTDEVAQRILDVRENLIENGWTQYRLRDAQGRMCVLGALDSSRALDVAPALVSFLCPSLPHCFGTLSNWNDVPGRTESEVLAKLHDAALWVKEKASQRQ